mgnify:CR=1 FL=1
MGSLHNSNQISIVKSRTGRMWMDRNLGALRVTQSVNDYQGYVWLYRCSPPILLEKWRRDVLGVTRARLQRPLY